MRKIEAFCRCPLCGSEFPSDLKHSLEIEQYRLLFDFLTECVAELNNPDMVEKFKHNTIEYIEMKTRRLQTHETD